jgi:ADP-ribosylglycohydrolase
MSLSIKDKLTGCLIGGAIGDSIGSFYESQKNITYVDFDAPFGITDDTQLTLATCESIITSGWPSPESVSKKFLEWFNKGKLSGLGSSTLKALRDLQVGAHWGLSGRSGEYAAGNGAAMRIAPLAFFLSLSEDRTLIKDICYITHKNDEAYVGSLSVLYALKAMIDNQWYGDTNLMDLIIPFIPDTLVRDNLMKLRDNSSISITAAAGLVGCSGHVAQSVPFSIFSASKIRESNFKDIQSEIIQCGGDTDTNASLAGQIMGTYKGYSGIPSDLISSFQRINESDYILEIAGNLSDLI